jgi:sugar lactone lactonase YvrE
MTNPPPSGRLTVVPVPGTGAEDVLVGDDDSVYTGTADGAIWRLRDDGALLDRVGLTGGRPLGLEWLPDGRMLVCDARRGLLALDLGTGDIETFVDLVEGRRMTFCNNAAVASDGTIWFSDSSRLYGIDRWKADVVENTASGRLLRRDRDGSVSVVLDGLRFANGVALAADESYVAVAETAGRTVVRHRLTGERAGHTDLLVGDLPGYPDNIARGATD